MSLSFNAVCFELITQHREKNIEFNIQSWTWTSRLLTVPTHTILHPQLEVNVETDFHAIPTSVCSRAQ